MTIRTILVCVSSAEASRATLQAACLLARNFDTHIEALHVRADPRSLVPYTGEGMDGSMIEEIMDVTEREGGQRAEAARQMFDELCREHSLNVADAPSAAPGPSISWREETGREDEVIAVRGRLYDAVVVGRAVRNSALPSLVTLEAALLDTGRPILVTPPNPPSAVGRSVAVAWESSPEAARAISFALPILAAADTVTILAPDPVEPPSIPVDELVSRLAWSGIEADVRSFDTKEVEIGAGFLRAAGEAGADLLVKGAYARSRVRQMVLGGRTRHIITHTGIPVLLSH